jgi:hypothetical protein
MWNIILKQINHDKKEEYPVEMRDPAIILQ